MTNIDRGGDWLAAQVKAFADDRSHWKAYAQCLERLLQGAANDAGVAAIVQARAKTVASFAEKAIRKQHKYADPLRQLTDLCGARVIVSSQEELTPICEFIESTFVIDADNSLDQRSQLRPREFGYRSVHYVVMLPPGGDTPTELLQRKAEIQVRTILQHGWADIGHDRLYKRRFQIPESWDRDAGRIAAMLEEADEMFARIIRQVDPYHASAAVAVVGSSRAAEEELQLLQTTLAHCGDPPPRDLLIRLARLALALNRDDLVLQLVPSNRSLSDPHLLHCCGLARCRTTADGAAESAYQQGLSELRQARDLQPHDPGFQLAYAEAARDCDPDGSRQAIEAAFDAAPTDPRVLVEFLRMQTSRGRMESVRLLAPTLRAAIANAQNLIAAGINGCQNGLLLSEMLGLRGASEPSVIAAIDALGQAHAAKLLIATERCWEALEQAAADDARTKAHWSTLRRLIALVGAAKFEDPTLTNAVKAWATPGAQTPPLPVVMLVGGCNPEATTTIASYRPLLLEAFADFRGTVISGGTTAGIAGIVGEIQTQGRQALVTRGYLPTTLPPHVHPDVRYRELHRTAGPDFSGLEPVQSWIDLVASGITPQLVRVVGLNGGPLAMLEYRLGLLLGATVGVIPGSGRAADQILNDAVLSDQILPLPADAATLRVFCAQTDKSLLAGDQREAVGRAIHAAYRKEQQARHRAPDPAMSEWDQLPDDLRASNLAQADDIGLKLQTIGLAVQRVTDRPVVLYEFSPPQIERLAELEHARWNVERLRAGWRYARERDTAAQRSPYLVAWNQLTDDVRQWDRQAVALIPQLLREAGYEIAPAD